MKTNSSCASDGSVTSANGFSEWNCINLGLALRYLQIIFGEELLLSLYLFSFSL